MLDVSGKVFPSFTIVIEILDTLGLDAQCIYILFEHNLSLCHYRISGEVSMSFISCTHKDNDGFQQSVHLFVVFKSYSIDTVDS